MARAVKPSQDDLLFLNVKSMMAVGEGNDRRGMLHDIVIAVEEVNQSDGRIDFAVTPIKATDLLSNTIANILFSQNRQHLKLRIGLGSIDQNLMNDLRSLGLSIAIGVKACLDWNKDKTWESGCGKWCFTGDISQGQMDGKIDAIGSIDVKLNAAVSEDGNIRYIMIPSGNRQEVIKWVENEGVRYEENTMVDIQIANNRKGSSFISRVWSLATGNTFTWIALILWILAITYLPVRYIFRDNIQTLSNGNSHVTIELPIENPERVKKRLLNHGFRKEQIRGIPLLRLSKRLAKANQSGRAIIINRDGTIEFEIINSQDWTLLPGYICYGYIAAFAAILVMIAMWKNRGSAKHNPCNIDYNSLLLTDKNKEIMFVNNIRDAETIVEYKMHNAAEF